MKREFLQLAHVYKNQDISSWFMSEKLDGVRVFWDGGISAGLFASDVPWANVEKDGRYVKAIKATGLWTRYGKTIQAPKFFLDGLPIGMPLDGELWSGRGSFQSILSTIKQLEADVRWSKIKLMVFDTPSYREVFSDGTINNSNFKKTFSGIMSWIRKRTNSGRLDTGLNFTEVQNYIQTLPALEHCEIHKQERLSAIRKDALIQMTERLDAVVEAGGEGLMLRNPTSYWIPGRVHSLLKFKPHEDDEGIVVGYVWGKETDKGSKLLGLMGAMIVEWRGKTFRLAGFKDEERCLIGFRDFMLEGRENQGEEVSNLFANPMFPRGAKITFKYRELTDDGVPKEARFLRKKENY